MTGLTDEESECCLSSATVFRFCYFQGEEGEISLLKSIMRTKSA